MGTNLIGIFKKLGKLSELRTSNKNSLVESLNEVSTKADKVDSSVANVEAGLSYNTIKVTKNDGTSENVLIKVQGGSGEAINVFKTAQQEGDYVAEGTTDSFVIEGVDSTKDVTLIYNNLYLVEGTDYTLDKSSGTVTLTFELVVDEVIHYIITSTSYEYSELNGLPDLSVYDNKLSSLENNINGFKYYKQLAEINPTFNESTPIKDVILGMTDMSILITGIQNGENAYPYPRGTLHIEKISESRSKVEYRDVRNIMFTTNYHSEGNSNSKWYEIPTVDKVKVIYSYSQLFGTTGKWTSIDECVSQLPNDCIFSGDLQSNFSNLDEFPVRSAMLIINKSSENRTSMKCVQSVEKTDLSTEYFSFYRKISTPRYFWKKSLTDEDKLSTTLQKLGFVDNDFSDTDFNANLIKIIEKIGYLQNAFFYFYENPYVKLNQSFKTRFGITTDGYALDIRTSSNSATPNIIYIYPNNTTDIYMYSYDNELRYGGIVSLQIEHTVDEYLNGWQFASWGEAHKLRVSRVGKTVTVIGTLIAGSVTDNTVICKIPNQFLYRSGAINFSAHSFEKPHEICGAFSIHSNGEVKIRKGNVNNGDYIMFNVSYRI